MTKQSKPREVLKAAAMKVGEEDPRAADFWAGEMLKDLDAAGLTISRKGEDAPAKREAAQLAMSLWRKHYREDSPNFELLDTTAGIITQIDNMTANLRRPVPPPPTDKRPDLLHDGATDDPNNKDCNITPGEARFVGEPDALREMAQRIYDIAQPLEGKTPFGQLVSVGDKLMGLARTALANTDGGWNYDLDDAPTGWPLDVASKGVAGPEVGIREVHADGSTTWLILDAGLADGSSPGWCHRLDAPVYAWRARPTPPTEAE